MSGLSPTTQIILQKLFEKEAVDEATRLLVEECGNNLPHLETWTPLNLERFHFAALKMSGGDLSKLREATELAKADWRDLLMSAGFGRDRRAHNLWAVAMLTK